MDSFKGEWQLNDCAPEPPLAQGHFSHMYLPCCIDLFTSTYGMPTHIPFIRPVAMKPEQSFFSPADYKRFGQSSRKHKTGRRRCDFSLKYSDLIDSHAIHIQDIAVQVDIAQIAIEGGHVAVAGQRPGGIAVQVYSHRGHAVGGDRAGDGLVHQVQRHVAAVSAAGAPGIRGGVQEHAAVRGIGDTKLPLNIDNPAASFPPWRR